MAVKKPQPALGKSIALKTAYKQLQTRRTRAMYVGLNLTAMVDMFTLLVIFLLANFSSTGEILFISKDITLPKAESSAELARAPVVSISAKSLSLEGREIMPTEEAIRDDVSTLEALTAELREVRKADEMLHPGVEFKGTVILHCDEGIAFAVVRKVMYAAAEAGYVDVNYAIMQRGASQTAAAL